MTLDDTEILAAWEDLARTEGLFCEPSSAAGLAALLHEPPAAGETVVVVITGHGLEDPASAEAYAPPPVQIDADPDAIAAAAAPPMIFQAPATSANIGAGFDTAAVAFDLWNELELTDGSGVLRRRRRCVRASRRRVQSRRSRVCTARRPGRKALQVHEQDSARAWGSGRPPLRSRSVSLAAAPGASAEELLAVGITLEPHADNLAAALLGGLTLSWDGRIARIADQLPLAAVAVVPKERTSTETSRKTLPTTVPHDEAAASAGRAALLGAGAASGDASLFSAAFERLAPTSRIDRRRRWPRSGRSRPPDVAGRRCRDRGRR